MATTDLSFVHLERELVCFICTEILYQPLTLIDCLHTFCGPCLKQWFSHQRQKALSSHSSTSNPYTCPTCRAPVKDARPDARVNTYLDMIITANPSRARSQEDRDEFATIYKSGENILPPIDGGRRRERRTRQDDDEVRDRRMVEEARERSMRDIHAPSVHGQDSLQPPLPPRHDQTSRSRDRDREREERRERRREQARREQRERAHASETTTHAQDQVFDEVEVETPPVPPAASSPRHPEAVEARQRQQTVAHQASLISLISSSEDNSSSGTGTGDSFDEARVYQEIMSAGLLDGIDIDSMTEAEQDMLAERIAEAYRQRRRANQQSRTQLDTAATSRATDPSHLMIIQSSDEERRRRRSGSRQRRTEITPTPTREGQIDGRHRTASNQPGDSMSSLVPPQSVVTHRRRTSNQSQSGASFSNTSRHSSPAPGVSNGGTRSTTNLGNHSNSEAPRENGVLPSSTVHTDSGVRSSVRGSEVSVSNAVDVGRASISNEPSLVSDSPRHSYAELADTEQRNPQLLSAAAVQHSTRSALNGLSQFDEPSVSCYRCHRADIQYEVYKHCPPCKIDLCMRCYRGGRGCNHWYGFGHAAMARFESSNTDRRDSESVDLPHVLIGRSTKRPEISAILNTKLAKDGRTVIPLTTRSDPGTRTQEGHFCDRCGAFANSCFWSCDYCNDGEWGFCRDCVNTHHCCTHPLLPIAHRKSLQGSQTHQIIPNSNSEHLNLTPSELHTAHLQPSPRLSQTSSANSTMSALAGPLPGYVNLNIPTRCDVCSQSIQQAHTRYHCPYHSSPTQANTSAVGDYDICVPCYHNLVKANRIKRDDGPAGWRKCPNDHRMIVTTFETDADGGYRRVVLNDLVGGWKLTDQAMSAWMITMLQRRDMPSSSGTPSGPTSPSDETASSGGTWTWREDATTTRRATRARTLTISPVSSPHPNHSILSGSVISSPTSSSAHSRFPPDGGLGAKGTALWSYYPEEGVEGRGELLFPRGAEIREIEDINGEWFEGVYAGDYGFGYSAFVRF